LFIPLACATLLQILMNSLLLCAATSRRVRTRLLKVALLHRSGAQVALLKVVVHTRGGEDGSRYRLFVSFHVAWTCVGLSRMLDY
jgi:hypothetical protein